MHLPTWDLTDLYATINDPQINDDLKTLTGQIDDFEGAYNHDSNWDDGKLLTSLKAYEAILDLLMRLRTYASLVFYANMDDENLSFYRRIEEMMCGQEKKLVFYPLAINAIDEQALTKMIVDTPSLHPYTYWFQQLRQQKPHQLDGKLEQLMLEKNLVAQQAWIHLYDQVLGAVDFSWMGEPTCLEGLTSKMANADPLVRKEAALILAQGLEKHLPIFTAVLNAVVKDKQIDNNWRSFKKPADSRHLANCIEPEVVEVLHQTVKAWYPRLSHRYYRLKAKLLGQEYLEYWDRNAPIILDQSIGVNTFSFDQAKSLILKGYHDFSPIIASTAQQFFDHRWIDASVRSKKTSGAFSHPATPSTHPYILLSYQQSLRDVMTLAHELGHGVNQYLCRDQGAILCQTPLTLAETASVFGEMLTFQCLLSRATTKNQQIQLLAMKIDDMMNTVVRQIAFYDFELQFHTYCQGHHSLSQEDLSRLWRETQQNALGPTVNLDSVTDNYWSYISHFVHAPFYVYAYAFGDCLVNSLYALYQQKTVKDFDGKYLQLLKAGGKLPYAQM